MQYADKHHLEQNLTFIFWREEYN